MLTFALYLTAAFLAAFILGACRAGAMADEHSERVMEREPEGCDDVDRIYVEFETQGG